MYRMLLLSLLSRDAFERLIRRLVVSLIALYTVMSLLSLLPLANTRSVRDSSNACYAMQQDHDKKAITASVPKSLR